MPRHLLVTGGCGFIGANFIHFVRRARPDWRITNFDCLSYSGNPENLPGAEDWSDYRFVKGDVCDGAALAPLMDEIDDVVHLAAESHVDRSILDSRPFIQTNVVGTQTLLDAARQARGGEGLTGRFLYVSTDEVYGSLPLDNPDLKFTETTPLQPRSPYAASKAAGDQLAFAYFHTFDLDVVITRCSNNFGRFQFPEKVIPLFVTNLLENRNVPLYGDGLNVRDWVHVDDHCEAILAVLEGGTRGGTYNIGGDNERSNLELTQMILSIMGFGDDRIDFIEDRPGHDRRYAIDGTKIASELGWKASRSDWPGALAETVQWYRENTGWWERVRSGAYREFYAQQYARKD